MAARTFSTKEGLRKRDAASFVPMEVDVGGRCPLGARFRCGRPRVKSLRGGPSDGFGSRSISVSGVHPCSRLRACEEDERAREVLGCFWWMADLVFIAWLALEEMTRKIFEQEKRTVGDAINI